MKQSEQNAQDTKNKMLLLKQVGPYSMRNDDPFGHRGQLVHGDDDILLLASLANDLLELHVRTGISLDNWWAARTFVERFYGPVKENGA